MAIDVFVGIQNLAGIYHAFGHYFTNHYCVMENFLHEATKIRQQSGTEGFSRRHYSPFNPLIEQAEFACLICQSA